MQVLKISKFPSPVLSVLKGLLVHTTAAMNPLALHSNPQLFQDVKETITWINCRIILTHETQFFVNVSVSH